MPLVYEELRSSRPRYLRSERPTTPSSPRRSCTRPTCGSSDQRPSTGRTGRTSSASPPQMMRRILVDHARDSGTRRSAAAASTPVALDEAVGRRARRQSVDAARPRRGARRASTALDRAQARIVELRFFGGLTVEETAEVARRLRRPRSSASGASRAPGCQRELERSTRRQRMTPGRPARWATASRSSSTRRSSSRRASARAFLDERCARTTSRSAREVRVARWRADAERRTSSSSRRRAAGCGSLERRGRRPRRAPDRALPRSCASSAAAAWARSTWPRATTTSSSSSVAIKLVRRGPGDRDVARGASAASGRSSPRSSTRTSPGSSTAARPSDGRPYFVMEYVEGEPHRRRTASAQRLDARGAAAALPRGLRGGAVRAPATSSSTATSSPATSW